MPVPVREVASLLGVLSLLVLALVGVQARVRADRVGRARPTVLVRQEATRRLAVGHPAGNRAVHHPDE